MIKELGYNTNVDIDNLSILNKVNIIMGICDNI